MTKNKLVCFLPVLDVGVSLLAGFGSNKTEAAKAGNYALIDLHLHLDGSLSLDCVKELADMQGKRTDRRVSGRHWNMEVRGSDTVCVLPRRISCSKNLWRRA